MENRYENVLSWWLRSATSLIVPTLERCYVNALQRFPEESIKLFEKHPDYLGREKNLFHFIDLVFCMFPYRDLQYGFKGASREAREKTRRLKLNWIAFHIIALENLKREKDRFLNEIKRISRVSEDELRFLMGYVDTTIAELCALYVYLVNDVTILPFGFMQHAIRPTGLSGPALGDFIEVDTLTFVDVKSSRRGVNRNALIRLMTSTRLPSAFIVPRYGVDPEKNEIQRNVIVLDKFEVGFRGISEKRNYRKAEIQNQHKNILSSVSLLEKNSEELLSKS